MRRKVAIVVFCILASCRLARADDPQPPKPAPEHEMLKKFVGEWDCTVSLGGMDEKGSAVYKLGFGGFWLTEEFKGEFGGQKFDGRGTMGYDPLKKKYISTWIDSDSPSMMVMEGAFDKDGTTYTETGDGMGMDGKPSKMKTVLEFKDKDSFHFTMYYIKDGKDTEFLKVAYKRKK
jgi:hypothetical protein